jgi:hypothetical protein
LAEQAPKQAGAHREAWDGKDLDGKIVPDEAYFFTIEAWDDTGGHAVYDPITFSGGEAFETTKARFDRKAGTLTYALSKPSRVLVRIGVGRGALLKTVVDWQPRSAGESTESWNGKDESEVIDLWERGGFRPLITYFTLPETSVITRGNADYTYRDYKSSLAAPRPQKPDRPMANARRTSPHFLASRIRDRSFKVLLSFPELPDTQPTQIPRVKDKVLVRVDVDAQDHDMLSPDPYEIIFFVNGLFLTEEERGTIPLNFSWDLQHLPEGEHTLTVNFVRATGQFGVGSRKVQVVK